MQKSALAYLMYGIGLGWLPPTLQVYKNSNGELSFTDEDVSWMVSSQYIGLLIGSLLVTLIADTLGRNAVLITAAILASVSWVGVAVTKITIMHLLIRLVAGMSFGLSTTVMPMYIGENSSPNMRGIFSSVVGWFIGIGTLLGCTVTTLYSYEISAYTMVVISLLNISSLIFLQEPAQHLLAKGRQKEAENQFFLLRERNEDTLREFDDMKTNLDTEESQFSFHFILNRYFQVVCVISVLMFLTGYSALVSLLSIIFMPTTQWSTNEQTILFQLLLLVGIIISPCIIDSFRRRTLWMFSAISIAIIHIFIAALCYARKNSIEIPLYEWLLFGLITGYVMIFVMILCPLVSIMKSELLSQRFRAKGTSASSILQWLTGSMIGYSFLWIASNFGIQTNFIGYAVFSLLLLFVCYFYLPETRGMTLTDIEKLLENSNK